MGDCNAHVDVLRNDLAFLHTDVRATRSKKSELEWRASHRRGERLWSWRKRSRCRGQKGATGQRWQNERTESAMTDNDVDADDADRVQ